MIYNVNGFLFYAPTNHTAVTFVYLMCVTTTYMTYSNVLCIL